ncbi:MAG: hypothetical protein ABEH38_10115 [Flavobacteriales bacterium]
MKRPILITLTFFFLTGLVGSCKSHERCPAYGKQVKEKKQEEKV